MREELIKVKIDIENAFGVDHVQEQLLREASWKCSSLIVDVPSEGRETKLKFLGGNWRESVL